MNEAAQTALAALQSSIAIVLIVASGFLCRRYNLLDERGESQISVLCNNVFLPALLITEVGPNIRAGDTDKILPLFSFAAIEMILGFAIGYLSQKYLSCPEWLTCALMFNNTTALPLLLARNLKETGTMEQLLRGSGDTADKAQDRLESYILINAVFHSVVRFGLGPYLMKRKEEKVMEDQSAGDETDDERTALLPHRRPTKVKDSKTLMILERVQPVATFIRKWFNPALLGALVAMILGLIPFTHTAFFNENGVFKSNLIQAIKQLGDLIPALLPFAVGSKLFSKPSSNSGWLAMFILIFVRFALMPGLSILAVWLAKRHNSRMWLDDPAFDFALIISGAGPPAVTMISVADLAHVSNEVIGQIARMLIISYLATPAMSGTVVAGLEIIKKIY